MWFSDIELPDELWRARDNGKLVIFAGAGVSCGPPSSLPLFQGLVDKLAEHSATPQASGESPDRYLGRLSRNGNKVHELARQILLNPESKPNALHALLLRLFGDAEGVRLVTTNFDRHFTTAGEDLWKDAIREYHAPALPLGDSFNGVVYLHGAAFVNPWECVLTDEDFGRAYLTEGWATRFLKDMFECFTVLFIGYGHNDTVMNYLARGLPPSDRPRRFALHHGSNEDYWSHLGIMQVHYPAECGDHSSLVSIFEGWVREVESGLTDWYDRLAGLGKESPATLSNADADFVRRQLSREDTAKRFLDSASDPAWVIWLEERGLLGELLRVEGKVGGAQEEIARWLVANFLDDQSRTLLAIVQRNHQTIHPSLWWHISRRLEVDTGQIATFWFRTWLGILLCESPEASKSRISDLIPSALYRKDTESLLLLMDRLVTPRIQLEQSFFPDREKLKLSTVLTLNLLTDHEDHWLREA